MMELRCYKCGAPLVGKKCDYCGAKKRVKEGSKSNELKEEQSDAQRKVAKKERSGGVVSFIIEVVIEAIIEFFV